MEISVVVAVLNIALLFLGFWAFGKGFAMSIIISTFAFPAFNSVSETAPDVI